MKAENQLQYMMDFFGDIFYSRKECLDHLFCVIGNGYTWKDGELIEKIPDERILRYALITDIIHAEPSEAVRNIRRIKEAFEKNDTSWYPIAKEYSYICNYPSDIKPDWLALLNECKAMLEAEGIEVPENNGYIYGKED